MDPEFHYLSRLAFGYWQAVPLFSLARLGVCDAIAAGHRRAEEIASQVGTHPEATAALLDAAVGLRLLEKTDERYDNTRLGRRFLISNGEESLVHWVRVMGRWMEPWTRLDEMLINGKQTESQAARLGEEPAYMTDFILGMHEYARTASEELASSLDLAGCRLLIDVGGGAGTFSIALCQRFPELRAVILDLESVLDVSRRLLAEHGLEDRIHLQVGDYRRTAYGVGADAVLLFNVLHQEAPATCHQMLASAFEALRAGGRLIVQGYYLNDDRTSPVFTTLHNLSARALWLGGRSSTTNEGVAMLETAGFVRIEVTQAGALTRILAHRPHQGENQDV